MDSQILRNELSKKRGGLLSGVTDGERSKKKKEKGVYYMSVNGRFEEKKRR